MCVGGGGSAPSPPKPPILPPPPKPQPPPPAPAPPPAPLQPQGAKPSLRVGGSRTAKETRARTTSSSLRSSLNINTGGEGGLNE